MSAIKQATEALIRLFQAEVHAKAALVLPEEVFEVKRTRSVLLQGPTLTEHRRRRTPARYIEKDEATLSFESCRAPRLYHLDFDVVVTTATGAELLQQIEAASRFYQAHPTLDMGEDGALNLTEETPLGGGKRVNLSNLRQASGRLRVEDCPVYDGEVEAGKLIRDRVFPFQDGFEETRTFTEGAGAT